MLGERRRPVPQLTGQAAPQAPAPGLDLFDAGHLTSVTQNLTKAIRFYMFRGVTVGSSAVSSRRRVGPSRRPGLDDRRPVLVLGRTALRLDLGPPAGEDGDQLLEPFGRAAASRSRSQAASAGLVLGDTATSTGPPVHGGRKNEQRCGSSAALTQIPAASASSNTCCCVASSVAVSTNTSRRGHRTGRAARRPRSPGAAASRNSTTRAGATTVTAAPAARSPSTCAPRRRLRRRARACPTGAGRPGRPSFHRGAGDQPLSDVPIAQDPASSPTCRQRASSRSLAGPHRGIALGVFRGHGQGAVGSSRTSHSPGVSVACRWTSRPFSRPPGSVVDEEREELVDAVARQLGVDRPRPAAAAPRPSGARPSRGPCGAR